MGTCAHEYLLLTWSLLVTEFGGSSWVHPLLVMRLSISHRDWCCIWSGYIVSACTPLVCPQISRYCGCSPHSECGPNCPSGWALVCKKGNTLFVICLLLELLYLEYLDVTSDECCIVLALELWVCWLYRRELTTVLEASTQVLIVVRWVNIIIVENPKRLSMQIEM